MNTLTIVILSIIALMFLAIMVHAFSHESEILEKAERSKFYHVLAKLTSSKYVGYYPNEGEVKAMKEYAKQPTEYDKHSVGSYFKLCDSLKSTLKTCGNFHNYSLNFNMGEVGTGVAVMVIFVIVITLGITLC
jgi:hypothetical protein